MAKAAKNVSLGSLSNQVYEILEPLEASDRIRLLTAVSQLFGDPAPNGTGVQSDGRPSTQGSGAPVPRNLSGNAQEFFARKAPASKGEMLAVAARYREQNGGTDMHTAEDFREFFSNSRQNFDRNNFPRDIKNAQHQAGFFNIGSPKGQYQLSYYGQQYIDALPDRDAVKKLRRPGRRRAAKAKRARKAGAK